MYNHGEAGQVPVFEAYNVTAKLGMMYAGTAEYSDLLLSSERQKLLARNPLRGPKTAAKQTRACEEALNNFALQTWPNNGLTNLGFLITWRQLLAKVAFQITSVEQLRKELLPGCLLYFSSLGTYANELVNIIIMSVQTPIVPALPAAPPVAPPATPPAAPSAAPPWTPLAASPVAPPAAPSAALPAASPAAPSVAPPATLPAAPSAAPLSAPPAAPLAAPPAALPAGSPAVSPGVSPVTPPSAQTAASLAEAPYQPPQTLIVTPQNIQILLQQPSSNILPNSHRMYKIANQYGSVIDFSSPDTNSSPNSSFNTFSLN